MPVIDSPPRDVHRAPPAPTAVCSYSSLAADDAEGWAEVDVQLSEWLRDPADLVDYDATPPSRWTIRLARNAIPFLRARYPVPTMVVPDGSGGISFEFHAGDYFRTLDLHSDGRLRWSVFRAGQLIRRVLVAVQSWT